MLPLKLFPICELRFGWPPQTHMSGTNVAVSDHGVVFIPNWGRIGIPSTLGINPSASFLVAGFARPWTVFVPVRRIPNRASLRRTGVNVEVKLTVNTCGERCAMPANPVGQTRVA